LQVKIGSLFKDKTHTIDNGGGEVLFDYLDMKCVVTEADLLNQRLEVEAWDDNVTMDTLIGTYSLTHSLAYSFTHWLTHSRTHWFTHSHTHWLTHSLTHLITGLLTHALTGLLTHSLLLPRRYR